MPCRECGKSARDQDGAAYGVCVGLTKKEDGTYSYWCLDCFKEELKKND